MATPCTRAPAIARKLLAPGSGCGRRCDFMPARGGGGGGGGAGAASARGGALAGRAAPRRREALCGSAPAPRPRRGRTREVVLLEDRQRAQHAPAARGDDRLRLVLSLGGGGKGARGSRRGGVKLGRPPARACLCAAAPGGVQTRPPAPALARARTARMRVAFASSSSGRGGVPGGSVAAGTCSSSAAMGLRRSMCCSTLRSSGRDAVQSGNGCGGGRGAGGAQDPARARGCGRRAGWGRAGRRAARAHDVRRAVGVELGPAKVGREADEHVVPGGGARRGTWRGVRV